MDARVSGKGRKRLYLQEKQNNLRGKAQTGKAGRKDGTMLDKIDLAKKISKEEYKKLEEELVPRIQLAQRRCKSLGIPVMILFEGWGASGKGTLIGRLIQPLDPRGFKVITIKAPEEAEAMRPFMWRFWTKTPASGRIHIFDKSWYERALLENKENAIEEINSFEQQQATGGYLIIKIFLHITKKEQKKRFEKLAADPATRWRVAEHDWEQNRQYKAWLEDYDHLLIGTDHAYAPWTVVEATDLNYASAKILDTVTCALEDAADRKEKLLAAKAAFKEAEAKAAEEAKKAAEQEAAAEKKASAKAGKKAAAAEDAGAEEKFETKKDRRFMNGVLAGVDLTKALTREEYKEKRKKLQDRLAYLHNEMYRHRIPVILAFEGWDAGGKGGAIKRLTEAIDPRGYEVCPTASPNDIERAHHYLWRFWEKVPKAGHLAIFDRTWYGRVMVERIEGFCSEADWKRAYAEINQMEASWVEAGCVVLKFWLHIDKDEQERRFTERMNTPEKQWKITDEDWRNRAKWDLYEEAVDDMVVKTSTPNAPWILVSGNNKYYARIQVLETVVEAIEKRLAEEKRKQETED